MNTSSAPHHTPSPEGYRIPDIKVCGLTREEDIRACLDLGVKYIGINRYAPSPRCVPDHRVKSLLKLVPRGRRVYVDVAPGLPELTTGDLHEFDIFQIHFDPVATPESRVALWADCVGSDRLWLAPKLKPGVTFPTHLLKYAKGFLLDGYSIDAYGGTGKTGDWHGLAALKSVHPENTWIVAGGLNPDNVVEALRTSHADILDLNSGVEESPGLKDHERIARAIDNIRQKATGAR